MNQLLSRQYNVTIAGFYICDVDEWIGKKVCLSGVFLFAALSLSAAFARSKDIAVSSIMVSLNRYLLIP
jgi:hypothetical protein